MRKAAPNVKYCCPSCDAIEWRKYKYEKELETKKLAALSNAKPIKKEDK